ncbi:MAG: ComEC/Rec2 family competence protein [Pseudomonadota bacterium]
MKLSFEPSVWTLPAGAGLLGLLLWALFSPWGNIPMRITFIIALGLVLGGGAGKLRTSQISSVPIESKLGPVMVEGWVSAVEPARRGVRLRIRPHAIAGRDPNSSPREIRLTHISELQVSSGRFVRCWSVLRPPPERALPGGYDFRRQAWFDGLGAVGYVQGRCRGGVLGAPEGALGRLDLFIAAMRRSLASFVQSASGERAGGFAAALISGDRSYMPQSDQDALRASGLAHLLAISGLHLGIVGGLVYFIFRRGLGLIEPLSLRIPVQKLAAIASLIAIAFYLVLSGASVSTQRAFIMSTVFFGAILIDRPALSLRSLSIAMIAVILLRPESVLSPGFQMSFAATGILIAIYENWSRRVTYKKAALGRVWLGVKSLFVTSIAASLATAPFAIFHFDRVAPLGIAANLAAMPVISLAAVPAAGLTILLAPLGLSEIGLYLFGKSLELVLTIAHFSANAGEAYRFDLPVMPSAVLSIFAGGIFAIIFFRSWLRLAMGALIFTSAFVTWTLFPAPTAHWASSGDVYIKQGVDRFDRIPFQEADALPPFGFEASGDYPPCDQDKCDYQTVDGIRLILDNRLEPSAPIACDPPLTVRLFREAPPGTLPVNNDDCGKHIAWRDIETYGGVSILRVGDRTKLIFAGRCSDRPWRSCVKDQL